MMARIANMISMGATPQQIRDEVMPEPTDGYKAEQLEQLALWYNGALFLLTTPGVPTYVEPSPISGEINNDFDLGGEG